MASALRGAIAMLAALVLAAALHAETPPAPSGPSAQPSADDAHKLVADLADADEAKRKAARERLAEMGPAAVDPLIAVLADPRMPRPHRMAAAEALVAVGRPAGAPLVACLASSDTLTRAAAVQVLGAIGNREHLRPILAALTDPEPVVRDKAAEALGRLGNPSVVVELVAVFRKDASLDVRATAAHALGRLASRAAIEPLIEGLADGQPQIRTASAEGLGAMGPVLASGQRGELGRSKAAKALLAALADTHEPVRAASVEALGLLQAEEAVAPLVGLVPEAALRLAAIKALGRIGTRPARAALRQLGAAHEEEAVRKAAQQALGTARRR